MKYTKWHEQKPAKTEDQKEARRENVNAAVKKFRAKAGRPRKFTDEEREERRKIANKKSNDKYYAKVGRPKKYDNEEDRRVSHNERQRKKYREVSTTKRDLSTQAGRIGAFHDLIDAM